MDPSAVVITGDLTDSKGADRFSSRLYKEEWVTYDRVMRGKACSQLNIFDIKVREEPRNLIYQRNVGKTRMVRDNKRTTCRAIMTPLIFSMMTSLSDYSKHILREVGIIPGTVVMQLSPTI